MSRQEMSALPHLALSVRAHNREGLHRADAAWLEAQWVDPSTRVLVVSGDRVDGASGHLHWLAPRQAPAGERVLLGRRDGVTRFAVLARREDVPGGTDDWVGLRGMFGMLSSGGEEAADEAPWLFHAVGLAQWRRSMRFCPRCAGSLSPRAGGHELVCAGCGRSQFPRTDPAVIMTITLGDPGAVDERVLLGRQAGWPATQWSTLAGFCEPGERLEDAVRRETFEETGIEVGEVDYFGSQPWPLPASLMVAFTGRALSDQISVDGAEIADARWFTRAELTAGIAEGTVSVPRSVSISASLLRHFHGADLPGPDVWGR